MNLHYTRNRAWSDQFLPDIKRIVGSHLLKAAPNEQDWLEATDLMLLDARDTRIAARVRRPGYAERFPHQFTIRAETRYGGETELAKIVNGKGDLMFYGHAAEGGGFASWYLIDLNAFRAAPIRHANGGPRISYGDKRNADGTAFKWFDLRSFPKRSGIMCAQS